MESIEEQLTLFECQVKQAWRDALKSDLVKVQRSLVAEIEATINKSAHQMYEQLVDYVLLTCDETCKLKGFAVVPTKLSIPGLNFFSQLNPNFSQELPVSEEVFDFKKYCNTNQFISKVKRDLKDQEIKYFQKESYLAMQDSQKHLEQAVQEVLEEILVRTREKLKELSKLRIREILQANKAGTPKHSTQLSPSDCTIEGLAKEYAFNSPSSSGSYKQFLSLR